MEYFRITTNIVVCIKKTDFQCIPINWIITVVWYGGVNVLGFSSDEENVIKVIDEKLADELILVLNQ